MIRDESHLTARPNVCSGERLEGRIVRRGGSTMFLTDDGRLFALGEGASEAGPAAATIVVQAGELPRAYVEA